MRINEIFEPEDIELTVQYHDRLNPAIWDNGNLRSEVRERLVEISQLYENFLDLPKIKVLDWTITGSNANYNWTEYSDIDLHLIVDFSQLRKDNPDLLDPLLKSKKKIWNDLHNITIYGFEVELYAQSSDEPHISTGVYSVKFNKWLTLPEEREPTIDDYAVRVKAAELMNEIDQLALGGCDQPEKLERLKDKIVKMRRAGLDMQGEFSTENLAFKTLRNNGYLEKLYMCHTEAVDRQLSLF